MKTGNIMALLPYNILVAEQYTIDSLSQVLPNTSKLILNQMKPVYEQLAKMC